MAIVSLCFVVLFKFTDAFAGVMIESFVLDLGFSLAEYAVIIKGVGLAATAKYIVNHEDADIARDLCQGFAESCANIGLGGLSLVLTWILVAVGIRRMPPS